MIISENTNTRQKRNVILYEVPKFEQWIFLKLGSNRVSCGQGKESANP